MFCLCGCHISVATSYFFISQALQSHNSRKMSKKLFLPIIYTLLHLTELVVTSTESGALVERRTESGSLVERRGRGRAATTTNAQFENVLKAKATCCCTHGHDYDPGWTRGDGMLCVRS